MKSFQFSLQAIVSLFLFLASCGDQQRHEPDGRVELSQDIVEMGVFYQVVGYTINYGYLCAEPGLSDEALRQFAVIQSTYLIESDKSAATAAESVVVTMDALDKRDAALTELAKGEGIEISFDSTLMSVLGDEPEFVNGTSEIVRRWWPKVLSEQENNGKTFWSVPPGAILEILDLAIELRSSYSDRNIELVEKLRSICADRPERLKILSQQFVDSLLVSDFR